MGLLVVVVVLLLWLAGVFHRKVEGSGAGANGPLASLRSARGADLVPVRVIEVPRVETAVGTVQAVHEVTTASKLLAKVTEVNVRAGQHVTRDEVLVRLDDADLAARLEQAEAAVAAAQAQRDQAKIEYDRVRSLVEREAAAAIEWDRVQSSLKSAEAQLAQGQQSASEARTVLSYATIRAPIDGIVVDKDVEAGDMVSPGQPLLKLYDPSRMQLVASVRESLARSLKAGQTIGVRIEALAKDCEGEVSEIVPEAESASRSFLVKVTGPCPPGIYSGMFGRLLIPLETQEVLVIPAGAVREVGQLTLVEVAEGEVLRRRAVQVGRRFDGDIEVLSGLRAGEMVAGTEAATGKEAAP